MKKIECIIRLGKLSFGLLFVCAVFLTVACRAAYSAGCDAGVLSKLNLEVSGDVNFSSIYMWRGIMLDGDAVVQPGLYVKTPESKFGRLKFGWWISHDLANRDALRSSETDIILDYTYSFKIFDLSAGHTYYDFPDALAFDGSPKGFSREFYAGLTFPETFLSPSVYYYYDYGKKEDGGGEGSYTVLNVAYSIPFTVKDTQT